MSSKIEWTGETWNPVTGCKAVSPGCRNCYAAKMTHRLAGMGQEKYRGLIKMYAGGRHFSGKVKCHEDALDIPFRWRKPRIVFVNSMSDLFHKGVPFGFIDRVFAVMALCPQHTFQILTKRPERMREYTEDVISVVARVVRATEEYDFDCRRTFEMEWPLSNVLLGVSVEDQSVAHRILKLRRTPAAKRFVSYEPALGPLGFDTLLDGIDWLIVGGESGDGARRFNLEWVWDAIQACKAHGTRCFVKQLGRYPVYGDGDLMNYGPKGQNFDDWPEDLKVREVPWEEAIEGDRRGSVKGLIADG